MSQHHSPSPLGRREGFLAGAVVGSALAARTADVIDPAEIRSVLTNGIQPLPAPVGRRHSAVALADGLLEELLSGGVDLRRLSGRWSAWLKEDGFGADLGLVEALEHFSKFDAPIQTSSHRGASAVGAVLPAALTAASPRSMLSGAFHTARLLDPDPDAGIAAAAVVVAAARLLEGHRDFMGDVLGVVRANDAGEHLFERFVAIPADPRSSPPLPRGNSASAIEIAIWVLWQVHHRPRSVESLSSMVEAGDPSVQAGAVLGSLLGARDGVAGWPAAWLERSGEEVALRIALAGRLSVEL